MIDGLIDPHRFDPSASQDEITSVGRPMHCAENDNVVFDIEPPAGSQILSIKLTAVCANGTANDTLGILGPMLRDAGLRGSAHLRGGRK